MTVTVRRAEPGDVPAITVIYNEAILTTEASFDTEPKTLEEQDAWFSRHDSRHPIMVAEQGGAITGWASLSDWSDRCAYANTDGSHHQRRSKSRTSCRDRTYSCG